jgi:hypothetical protein
MATIFSGRTKKSGSKALISGFSHKYLLTIMEDKKKASAKFLWTFGIVILALVLANSYYIYVLNGHVSRLQSTIDGGSGLGQPVNDGKGLSNFSIVEKTIPFAAVSSANNGSVGNLSLKLIPGNNNVLINTNPFLGTDLQYAINTAVTYAKLHSQDYQYHQDFIFDFKDGETQLISGGSAGAAATILAIAAIENKELKKDVVITGTINPNGSIGKIGEVLEKARAVSEAGYKYFLVPKGQANVTYYERQTVRQRASSGRYMLYTKYIPKTIHLKQTAKDEWGLNVVEVSNIDEALPYFIAN